MSAHVDRGDPRIAQWVDLAVHIARRAGALIHEARPEILDVGTKSTPTDPVTEMDRASEELIRAMVAEHAPLDSVFGEEGDPHTGSSGLTWVVDPIDGTVNYVHHLPMYAVSVALVQGGVNPRTWQPLAGCVYAPAMDRCWSAGWGLGAFLNGQRLALGSGVALSSALIGTGFEYCAQRRQVQGQLMSRLINQVADIRRMGAAAIDLCAVASGWLDGYFESGLKPWDVAAGSLVVTEAGGQVTWVREASQGPDLVVAGGERVLNDLVQVLTMPAPPTPGGT